MGSDGVRSPIVVGLAAVLLGVGSPLRAQTKRTGSPEQQLPREITRLTGFGERAAWSPDDKHIAFMGKSFGDAFEFDLTTGLTRLVTGHFQRSEEHTSELQSHSDLVC